MTFTDNVRHILADGVICAIIQSRHGCYSHGLNVSVITVCMLMTRLDNFIHLSFTIIFIVCGNYLNRI
jgi:hypothetical protein